MVYPKAVVVHSKNRDQYQLPIALHEDDLLRAFVTDQYFNSSNPLLALTLRGLMPPRLRSLRHCSELDTARVYVSAQACCASLLTKFVSHVNFNRAADLMLGRQARTVAALSGAAVFSTSYQASAAFAEGVDRPQSRFLFQLHPHPEVVQNILTEELERMPSARASLMYEHELSLSEREFKVLSTEPSLANGWVCASSYTAETLAVHGAPPARIHVVPYGVNAERFTKRTAPPVADKPFTVIFVGSIIQRKGISYLLDAIRLLRTSRVRVILCGRGLIDRALLACYGDLNIEVKAGLPFDALVREIHGADLFVFPTLAEGFAHVVLEAMSCGVPVIATSHCCAPDVMRDGEHGFIIPIRDATTLAEKLAWGMDHRDELSTMGAAAAEQARLFTWGRFRAGIRSAYRAMTQSLQEIT